jgi:hypothetical protein
MSGILERMAKRTLGALPSVEPLAATRFAPADRGSPERPLELDTHLELEIDAPASRTDPTPIRSVRVRQAETDPQLPGLRTRPTLTRIQQAEDNWGPPSLEHREEREDIPALSTLETAKAPARADVRESQDRIQPLTPIAGDRAVELKSLTKINLVTAPLVSEEPAREPEWTAGDLRRATESAKPGTPVTARERFAEIGVRRPPPMERDDPRPKDHAAPLVVKRTEPVAKAPGNDLRGSVASAPSLEQKTEIHISIGSIELRAPREEAKPSATPFRPRLSLGEFLRREPGA